jgi:hypothetical protein
VTTQSAFALSFGRTEVVKYSLTILVLSSLSCSF